MCVAPAMAPCSLGTPALSIGYGQKATACLQTKGSGSTCLADYLDDYFIPGIAHIKALWKTHFNQDAGQISFGATATKCLMSEAKRVLETGAKWFSPEENQSPMAKGIRTSHAPNAGFLHDFRRRLLMVLLHRSAASLPRQGRPARPRGSPLLNKTLVAVHLKTLTKRHEALSYRSSRTLPVDDRAAKVDEHAGAECVGRMALARLNLMPFSHARCRLSFLANVSLVSTESMSSRLAFLRARSG